MPLCGPTSSAPPLATLQELEHLGVGFVSLTEALDLTTLPVAMAGLLAIFVEFERGDFAGANSSRAGPSPFEWQTAGSA